MNGFSCGGNRSKNLLLSLGLRPYSQVVMFIHPSKFACLNLPICLVCCWQTENHKTKLLPMAVQNRLPWSQNDILRLVESSLSCGSFLYHGLDGFCGFACGYWVQDKNNKNPLRLMHDVSCESLMLRLSENPQASLDIFRQSHHHPFGSLHLSQGDKHGINRFVLWRTALQAEV